MKALITILILVLTCFQFLAQNDDNDHEFQHKLGLHAGLTTGVGFSYKLQYSRIAFQVVAFPSAPIKEGKYRMAFPIYGGSMMFSLIRNSVFDFFVYGGVSVFNVPWLVQFQNSGIGPGFELHLSRIFNVNVQAGVGYFQSEKSSTIYPTFELGMHFQVFPRSKKSKSLGN